MAFKLGFLVQQMTLNCVKSWHQTSNPLNQLFRVSMEEFHAHLLVFSLSPLKLTVEEV